jgi:hypothetical protein
VEAAAEKKAKNIKGKNKEEVKSNKEKLEEIKKELVAEPKPDVVTQEASSDEELAADEELSESKDNK